MELNGNVKVDARKTPDNCGIAPPKSELNKAFSNILTVTKKGNKQSINQSIKNNLTS